MKVRIQFDMKKESVDRLEKIREKTKAPSKADVVRKALGIYQWIIEEQEKGWELFLEKENVKKGIFLGKPF